MKENWGGTPGPVVTGEVIFVKVSKPIIFLVKSFLGNFYRHLAIFFWSHWPSLTCTSRQLQCRLWFWPKH